MVVKARKKRLPRARERYVDELGGRVVVERVCPNSEQMDCPDGPLHPHVHIWRPAGDRHSIVKFATVERMRRETPASPARPTAEG